MNFGSLKPVAAQRIDGFVPLCQAGAGYFAVRFNDYRAVSAAGVDFPFDYA